MRECGTPVKRSQDVWTKFQWITKATKMKWIEIEQNVFVLDDNWKQSVTARCSLLEMYNFLLLFRISPWIDTSRTAHTFHSTELIVVIIYGNRISLAICRSQFPGPPITWTVGVEDESIRTLCALCLLPFKWSRNSVDQWAWQRRISPSNEIKRH